MRHFNPNASVYNRGGAPYAVPVKSFDIRRGIRTCLRGIEYEGPLTSNVKDAVTAGHHRRDARTLTRRL